MGMEELIKDIGERWGGQKVEWEKCRGRGDKEGTGERRNWIEIEGLLRGV